MSVVDRRVFGFLFDWLEIDGLLARPHFADADRDMLVALFDAVERLSNDVIAPPLRASDVEEPRLAADGSVIVHPQVIAGVRQMADAGLFGLGFDTALGGLQLPHIVQVAAMGMLMAGSISTASFLLLTVANAGLLTTFGSPEQIAAFAAPQIAGTALGTMCLSEPHAGSSLADIRTRAVPDDEDALGARYRLSGAKMWISGGDHGVTEDIVHLVLAKIPQDDGTLAADTHGISLFVVPKRLPDGSRNDIVVAGLNHKMGYRGLPNCALNFGEGTTLPEGRAGAIGWRIGAPGQGLPQMFRMMNEARISVGLGAAMLAHRGYLLSLAYAQERRQGRLPGTRGGEQVPIIAHADVRRMLMAQKVYAQGALALVLFGARLVDEERTAESDADRRRAAALLGLLTPAVKSWPAEMAQNALHHALQIHGGAGYTRDFEIELLYRYNRLNPIHEGTTGVQAQDLVSRKLRKNDGKTLAALNDRVETSVSKALPIAALAEQAAALSRSWTELVRIAATLIEADEGWALAHATEFLFAFGHAVVGWLWLDQALHATTQLAEAAPNADPAFLRGVLHGWRYFAETELPLIAAWLAPIDAGTDTARSISDDEF